MDQNNNGQNPKRWPIPPVTSIAGIVTFVSVVIGLIVSFTGPMGLLWPITYVALCATVVTVIAAFVRI